MKEDIDGLEPAFHRIVGTAGTDFYGFVVIDRFVAGRGTGGIRFTDSVTLDEVARLAREMTFKFSFLHLPSGGAKAGLVARPGVSADEREQLFHRFGESIGDLIRDRRYVGGLDMGTSAEDLAAVMSGAGLPIQPGPKKSGINSNYFTALTVFVTADALLEARARRLNGASVLLEGVGKVGTHLLQLLGQAGARVVGISTLGGAIYNPSGLDIDAVLRARSEHGDDFVKDFPNCKQLPAAELYTQQADLLIPGGGADSLRAQNIGQISARWIVPVANICASTEIEKQLFRSGIEFVPGFVANSGGIFCWYLGRLSSEAREDIIRDRFKARIGRLIEAADQSGRSISETARDIAARNLVAMQDAETGNFWHRLAALGRKLSPGRLAYSISSRLYGGSWSRQSNPVVRAYYDARYFR
ncbi:MAG: Glu/Leu/Phe/Val dehydrogenase dimerization domain-containing protein [Woeseiaceae bacterium]|nr:Glu/Leu/Phe/Val dehydrogenase dimerization domain-containing protein [Woeseiaceae bacterium]